MTCQVLQQRHVKLIVIYLQSSRHPHCSVQNITVAMFSIWPLHDFRQRRKMMSSPSAFRILFMKVNIVFGLLTLSPFTYATLYKKVEIEASSVTRSPRSLDAVPIACPILCERSPDCLGYTAHHHSSQVSYSMNIHSM